LQFLPARIIGDGLILAMAEVLGQFGIQGFLDQQLGQLLEHPVLANQVIWLLIVRWVK